jgi:hypothetical protein
MVLRLDRESTWPGYEILLSSNVVQLGNCVTLHFLFRTRKPLMATLHTQELGGQSQNGQASLSS